MSLKTSLQNLRSDVKIMQERNNAAHNVARSKMSAFRLYGIPFVAAFLFMLMAIAVPAQAGTLNDSVAPIITDVSELFTPILSLIVAAVPVVVATAMIGFLLGILSKILGHL